MPFSIKLDKKIPNAPHYTWHEALWLPKWQIHCLPQDNILSNIQKTAVKMERIRELVGGLIHVHSWLRPELYNELVGGANESAHITGCAVDFHASNMNCDKVRERLEKHLIPLGIRMEKNPGSSWVHIDIRPPGPSGRFFSP